MGVLFFLVFIGTKVAIKKQTNKLSSYSTFQGIHQDMMAGQSVDLLMRFG
jgi:hypothetical protein